MTLEFIAYGADQLEVWCSAFPTPIGWIPVVSGEVQDMIAAWFIQGYNAGLKDGELEHMNKLREVFGFKSRNRFE